MAFVTEVRSLPYDPENGDTAALFQQVADPHNSLLLESADIESKRSVQSLAILSAALRVTCHGQRVRATALTPVGEEMLARLQEQLAPYWQGGEFVFTPSTQADERARLRDTSTVAVLRALQQAAGYETDLLPFIGGGFAFDYLETFEKLPPVTDGPNTYPDYEFIVAETLLAVDHVRQSIMVHGVGVDAGELANRLDNLVTVTKLGEVNTCPKRVKITAIADVDDATFRRHITTLKHNIHNGDIYQVVPARSFRLPCDDAFAAYQELRRTNPSPYMFYVRGADYELFGASPESNLKFTSSSREVELYPIAGTRPRGLNADGTVNHELDIRNELDMRTDTKEVAEHTMLVDLARNDLARVAEPGTRKVADLLQVDRYSRVMHLVSRVTATLHSDFDALDAYRACMNMGTLTGAPKLRATELIREVEGTRRGSYGGAIGYLRGDGSMDTCIIIRSAFVREGTAIVQAGAGVVRDSVPQKEADETLHKAYAVLNAIALAHGAQLEVQR